jgi:hypothetical protein
VVVVVVDMLLKEKPQVRVVQVVVAMEPMVSMFKELQVLRERVEAAADQVVEVVVLAEQLVDLA